MVLTEKFGWWHSSMTESVYSMYESMGLISTTKTKRQKPTKKPPILPV